MLQPRQTAISNGIQSALAAKQSARVKDINGFVEIKDNPISKAGIFDYSGAQLGLKGADANKIFKVYRPAEELSDPECLDSFKLLPFIDEHAMLGDERAGALPAERKGVQGFIGEQVRFDPPYLRGNLKIVSESMKSLIDNGKIELSPGYRCKYEFTPGTFDGAAYDVIQRKIRGNHLALVDEGRTGPDVAVLDKMTFTVDTKELAAMAEETQPGGGGEALARIESALGKLIEMLAPKVADTEQAKPAADAEPPKPAVAADAEAAKAMDAKLAKIADGVELLTKAVTAQDERLKKVEGTTSAMDASLLASVADRDTLASRLSGFVGTFDHARMTVQQVAEYGVEKLKVPCTKGSERIALDAYLHGRTPSHKQVSFAQDDVNGVDILRGWTGDKKGAN